MVGSSWRRRRDGLRPDAESVESAEMISAATRTAAYTSPSPGPVHQGSVAFPSIDLTDSATAAPGTADEYSAWAERLRQKRVEAKQVISGQPQEPVGSNWSAQNVFAESRHVADTDPWAHRDPVALSAAYAVLGLEIGASIDEVDARYRKLAKEHHPDRFVGSDVDVQRGHAEKFRAISTAREVLRPSRGAF